MDDTSAVPKPAGASHVILTATAYFAFAALDDEGRRGPCRPSRA